MDTNQRVRKIPLSRRGGTVDTQDLGSCAHSVRVQVSPSVPISDCGGIGRRNRLKICRLRSCRFDSGQSHHKRRVCGDPYCKNTAY